MEKIKYNLKNKIKLKFIIILIYLYINNNIHRKVKKIGIIGLPHSQNIGNNLLKYAIYIKISELGYEPYIIGQRYINDNITFINNSVKLRLINKSFNEINESDYEILMVNSDQTWRRLCDHFYYDIAFLKFAKNWNKPKFVYGASLGTDIWEFTKNEELIIKYLIKNFTGISVREKGSIKLIENHLGIKPTLVLDPTLLIDKKYYLNLIKNFKIDNLIDYNYIFIYTITNSKILEAYIKNITKKYFYSIYSININVINQIEKFIYGIYKSKAVITDSFHGTLFSLIFNKPFISFVYEERGNERFNSLSKVFNLHNRIFPFNSTPDVQLLETPLNFNKNALKSLKKISINYLKQNLNK